MKFQLTMEDVPGGVMVTSLAWSDGKPISPEDANGMPGTAAYSLFAHLQDLMIGMPGTEIKDLQ